MYPELQIHFMSHVMRNYRGVFLYGMLLMAMLIGGIGVSDAQQSANNMTKFSDPSVINPLKIDLRDFDSEDLKSMKDLANMLYLQGNYLEAVKVYLYIVNRNADDCGSYYRIACCYGKMDMPEQAVNFLIMSLNAGYVAFNIISNEDAFDAIRNDPGQANRYRELEQYAANFGDTKFFEVRKMERCQLFLPPGFNPEKEYPLIIGLHGNSGNALEFSGLWKYFMGMDVIYAVPESPYNYSSLGGALTQDYTWSIPASGDSVYIVADRAITEYISGMSEALAQEYKVSTRILLGFSQGAAFGYATAIRYHKQFDGLICFGGRLPDYEKYPWLLSEDELEANNDLIVFIAHGLNDQSVDISEGRKSYRILKRLGYRVTLKTFDGGHYVPGDVVTEAINRILTEKEKGSD